MPKKEKKEKKKKDGSSAESDRAALEKEKNLYLTQIQFLTEQSERFKLKWEELQKQHKDLSAKFSAFEEDKKDIVEYLKHSLLQREEEVDVLKQRVESLVQASTEEREAMQLQQIEMTKDLRERAEKLTVENEALAERLADLEEFQKNKDQVMSKMESLEKQLASQKEEHKAAIHSVEIKALMERKRLEKEMESLEVAMAVEVQHLVNQKLPDTTRLTMEENMEVKARFNQLSEEVVVLMGENTALRASKTQLSVNVDTLEKMLSEVSRQNGMRKKAMEQLTSKCQRLQTELDVCREEIEQLRSERKEAMREMEALRLGWASLSEQYSANTAELNRVEAELQVERRRRRGLESIMQEAVHTLRKALKKFPADEDLQCTFDLQWKQLMQLLLEVLDQPVLAATVAENRRLNQRQTSDPAASRSGVPNQALKFQSEPTRYRPGDAPRPSLKQKHPRTAAGSNSAIVPLHRKPFNHRAAVNSHLSDTAIRLLNTGHFSTYK